MGLILGREAARSKRPIGFARQPEEQRKRGLIRYSGDGHLITIAPTGTGKTTGPVICNALTHQGQLIVIDIKGEVYAATADARRRLGEVHVLDLRDEGMPGSLNPLDLAARCGNDAAAVARSFAAEMIERTGNEDDLFWLQWAETMLTGAMAWLLADCPAKHRRLSKAFELFTTADVDFTL